MGILAGPSDDIGIILVFKIGILVGKGAGVSQSSLSCVNFKLLGFSTFLTSFSKWGILGLLICWNFVPKLLHA